MNWKDPKKELPHDQQVVAILIYHWKNNWPQSAEISFGTCFHYPHMPEGSDRVTVENCDMIGGGSLRWHFGGDYPDSDSIAAWCDAKEFKKPDFLNHNTHWGPEFTPY